ncbi:down syndrome cell adhesion molecule, partial [Caerostris extrusa]
MDCGAKERVCGPRRQSVDGLRCCRFPGSEHPVEETHSHGEQQRRLHLRALNPRAHRFNNGTLVLSDVEETDAGSYLCQASNGIAAGLSKIITLQVLVPPTFKEPFQTKTVTEESNTTLRCIATGHAPIVITWQKDKSLMDISKRG